MPKLDKRVYIILLIQITEVLGFSLILPFLPFFAQSLGATDFTVGFILTIFSFFQFIASPIAGYLSDIYGRRPLLLISQFSTLVSFLVLGFAKSLPLLFLSRIIDGLFGSNHTIAQAYLTDISTKKNRSKTFAFTGIAFGIGFMIGPLIGGLLSQSSYSLAAFFAASLSAISIILTFFLLPETVKKGDTPKPKKLTIIDYQAIIDAFKNKTTRLNLSQFFIYIFAQTIWTSLFSLFAQKQYSITATKTGLLLALLGFTVVITRSLIIPRLIDKFGEKVSLKIGVVAMIIPPLAAILSSNYYLLMPLLALYAFGSGASRPLLMSLITSSAQGGRKGSLLGVANSLASLAQIIAPMLGAFLLSQSTLAFAIASSSLMFFNLFLF